eukprot:g3362.t1
MTDLARVCFRDDIWLRSFPLNKATAFDYFSLSQFYDATCNNESLKMQRRALDEQALSLMTGIEYQRIESGAEPALFIFKKLRRDNPSTSTPLMYYYILHGSIYQCPTIHSVFASRVMNCSFHLSRAFSNLRHIIEKTKETATASIAAADAAGKEASRLGTMESSTSVNEGIAVATAAAVSALTRNPTRRVKGKRAVDELLFRLAQKHRITKKTSEEEEKVEEEKGKKEKPKFIRRRADSSRVEAGKRFIVKKESKPVKKKKGKKKKGKKRARSDGGNKESRKMARKK